MKYLILVFILFYGLEAFAQNNFYYVRDDDKIRIIQNGKEYFLIKGDLIQIGAKNSWKRGISIINTKNKNLSSGPAHMGDKTYQEHIDLDRFEPLKSKRRVITKKISIMTSSGKKTFLYPGDEILINDINGWKRNIEVIKSKVNLKGGHYIGEKTYQAYRASEIIKNVDNNNLSNEKSFMDYRTLDDLIASLRTEQVDIVSESELEDGKEVEEVIQKCPKEGDSFKIDKSIYFLSGNGKTKFIPKNSIIKINNGSSVCEFELLKLPKESLLQLSDYPRKMKTYPLNLNEDILTKVKDPNDTISLSKGVEFKLKDGAKINAIGRRTGKPYVMSSDDVVSIVGMHRNGDYIVKKNNEKWEYRVSSDDLDEMNQDGVLTVDVQSTANTIIEKNLINEESNIGNLTVDCNNYIEKSSHSYDIAWQECRSKRVRTNSGKTLKANNYIEKSIPLSGLATDLILEDKEKKGFSKCISNSLRHGTNVNTNPTCKKDASGKFIPQRIRQALYVKKNGVKTFSKWSLKNKAPRACASKKLSTYLADRFVDMSRCLGVDPKELFPIINHESHFQPNTVSPGFAIGVGQIVTTNYLDFYNRLNGAKSYIKRGSKVLKYAKKLNTKKGYSDYENSSSKPIDRLTAFFLSDLKDKMTGNKKECKGLKNIYSNPMVVPKWANKTTRKVNSYVRSKENTRVCMPKNPDEGLYMSAIYYLNNKKYYTHLMDKKNASISPKMSASKVKNFSAILSQWSYNGGVAGISAPFERLLEKIKQSNLEVLDSKGKPVIKNGKYVYKKITSIAQLSSAEFKKYMSYVIKHRYKHKSERRRNEVANYVVGKNGLGGIDGDLKQTEKGDVGSCGNTL